MVRSTMRCGRRISTKRAGISRVSIRRRAHLRDVDRRLERTNQIVFNLTAERGVAVKRIEATQSVLDALEPLRQAKKS